ncbi:MAG TPA: adenylate/guanylate cyclase domain-containing protein [Methylomirabilota bacterium]|nr:adenylate/guanylate cyclase domain-containing protein [Methylomirabilota bacterium]
MEGERKQVTVLFADLKGSMELLADRDPEEARKILDPVLELMMEAVHRYEGTVNQVMGDGIMALFGAPLAHEDHAVRACYAALRMQESVKRYADEVRRAHAAVVKIRVGLNSGEVVVRAIGSDLHMDYTAVGQTTHLAARMEQLADPGAIVITPETLALVEGYVEVKALGTVLVKGLADAMEVYEVTGAGLARTRLQAAARRGLTRFVGRDAELEQLRRSQQLVASGHGQIAAIVGEAGVGKSRLVYEFTHSHRLQGWLVLESASVSYGKATAYLPVIEMLRGYFELGAGDDARRMREKVTGKLLALDRTLEASLPALLALLDLPTDDPSWEALAPPERRPRTLEAVKRLLLRESQVQPVLLLFEDLHWIDAETQAVLNALVEALPAARLLLLVNYRPEYRHGWSGKTYYRQIQVEPLAPQSAEALLDSLVGRDARLGPMKRLLIERTQGNPFFLEESIQALVEMGALAGEPGAYAPPRAAADVRVPPTVQAVLAARIDRLPPEEKHLLQLAGAIGKDVPLGLLQAVAGLPEEVLRARLARLQAGEFVYEASLFPEAEYTFKHALTHEVAYQGLLVERRRELHARILDAMEALYADRLTEHVESLARHAQQGGRPERAVCYLRQAAAKAIARSANHEAVAFLQGALSGLAELPATADRLNEALDIRLDLGPALIVTAGGTAPETHAVYACARERCEQIGDSARLFQALWGLWYTSVNRGQHRETRALAQRLLAAARDAGDSILLLEAHHSLCATLFQLGELSAARPHFDEGLGLYDPRRHRALAFRYGGHDPGVCTRSHLSLTLWAQGYPDQAVRCSEEVLGLARGHGHPPSTIIAYFMAAELRGDRGEHDAAAQRAEVVAELSSVHGQMSYLDRASTLLGALRVEPGPGDDLPARLAHALTAARRGGWNWRDLWALARLMVLCGRAGHVDQALAALAEIAAGLQPPNLYEGELYRLRGQLLERQTGADPTEAEAAFRRAAEIARARGHKSFELRAATDLARLLGRQQRRDEARRELSEIYTWFTEGFDTADLKEAKSLLDELA